ncbi:MAG: M23 family metallopeptidase [Burkholderiaceae bacterium]
MAAEIEPIIVDFPLRGEWVASSTPAEKIPSHGTDRFGQRFAFDFFRIEHTKNGWKFFRTSTIASLLFGIRLQDCYAWSEPIHAPFDGTVISSRDGWPERKRWHIFKGRDAVTNDFRSIAGNHIIIKMKEKEVYAFFAHARCGSIQVRDSDEVRTGQHLADVGHSGQSLTPHLHFHLMDRANILEAQGLPCCFREYQTLRDGVWSNVSKGIPGKREFIRYVT